MTPLVLDAHGQPIVIRAGDGSVFSVSGYSEPDLGRGRLVVTPEPAPLPCDIVVPEAPRLLVASKALPSQEAAENRREEAMRRLGAFNEEIAAERAAQAAKQADDIRYFIDGLRTRDVL